MKRRDFNFASLMCLIASNGIGGCEQRKSTEPNLSHKHTHFFSIPFAFPVGFFLLPEKKIYTAEFSPITSKFERVIQNIKEDRKNFIARCSDARYQYAQKLMTAQDCMDASLLHVDDHLVLKQMHKMLGMERTTRYTIRYDSSDGSNQVRVSSVDLLGVRVPKYHDNFIYASDSDPDLNQFRLVSNEVFGVLSELRLSRLFLNYSKCNFSDILNWAKLRKFPQQPFECLGVPKNINAEELSCLLEVIRVQVIDLSGLENDKKLLMQLISVANKMGVEWVIITETVEFNWLELDIDSSGPNGSLRGVIGMNSITVIEN